MLRLRNIAVLLAPLLLVAASAHAQSIGGQPDPVQYTVAPEIPGPNTLTSIQVEGVGGFLGNATITWTLNGKITQSGAGSSFFSFSTGSLGTQTTVKVTIDSETQGIITRTFTFTPSTINLIWEANTTVPPLFAGKALYSPGSTLRVVAFPTVITKGARVAAQSLSYQWSLNGTPNTSLSGLGKFAISFKGDQLQNGEAVSVDVYLGSAKVGHGELVVPSSNPQILFYAKDPLRGVLWEQALPQNIQLNSKEFTVKAQPYYFASESAKSALSYSWTLNDQETTGPYAAQGELTLRQTGEGQGSAALGLSIQNNNTDQFVQAASVALQLIFGKQTSALSSFFGL